MRGVKPEALASRKGDSSDAISEVSGTLQDTLYNNLVRASTVRYRTGESTLLEKTTSEAQSLELKNRMQQNEIDILIAQQQLQGLLNTKENITAADTSIAKREIQLPTDSRLHRKILRTSKQT
jgi:hypothetical protein